MAQDSMDQVARTSVQRVLIDAPIASVFKRATDLRSLTAAVPQVRTTDATPAGDTLRGELFRTVGPFRARFVGTAAVVDIDELQHCAVIQLDARDLGGRGRLTARCAVTMVPVGDGTEVTLELDVRLAGGLVRFTGAELLGDLDAAMRAAFVALAGDAFVVPGDAIDGEPLFRLEADDVLDLTSESAVEAEKARADELDLTHLEADEGPTLGRTEPAVMLFRTDAQPAVALAQITSVLQAEADRQHESVAVAAVPVPETSQPAPVSAVVTAPSPTTAPGRRVRPIGLPAASMPRRRRIDLDLARNRAVRATQTVATVAAGAAVVAAVAGAVVGRRWFGRR